MAGRPKRRAKRESVAQAAAIAAQIRAHYEQKYGYDWSAGLSLQDMAYYICRPLAVVRKIRNDPAFAHVAHQWPLPDWEVLRRIERGWIDGYATSRPVERKSNRDTELNYLQPMGRKTKTRRECGQIPQQRILDRRPHFQADQRIRVCYSAQSRLRTWIAFECLKDEFGNVVTSVERRPMRMPGPLRVTSLGGYNNWKTINKKKKELVQAGENCLWEKNETNYGLFTAADKTLVDDLGITRYPNVNIVPAAAASRIVLEACPPGMLALHSGVTRRHELGIIYRTCDLFMLENARPVLGEKMYMLGADPRRAGPDLDSPGQAEQVYVTWVKAGSPEQAFAERDKQLEQDIKLGLAPSNEEIKRWNTRNLNGT